LARPLASIKDGPVQRRIYLDYNASTPIADEVRTAMEPLLSRDFGNPSSLHWAGAPAKIAVERARAEVASLVGAAPEEIVFTSGGSEANNLAIKGVFFRRGSGHIITSAIEHPATLNPARFLERLGAALTVVPVDRFGRVDPRDIERAIRPNETILISVMHANNEVGTIQPIREIAEIAHSHGVPMHTDAAQSAGKIEIDTLGADLLSLAGHKLYAPKGVGALYVRRGLILEPLIHGGGHESGRRAGTESALLAVGLGAAAKLARASLHLADRIRALRDRLHDGLSRAFGDRVVLNGHPTERLPNTLNLSFVGRPGAEILAGLEGVAASTGSACHEGSVELSPVLRAMGVPTEVGMGAVRFSLGRATTEEEIDLVVAALSRARSAT
jgi:cysteine desulfurase